MCLRKIIIIIFCKIFIFNYWTPIFAWSSNIDESFELQMKHKLNDYICDMALKSTIIMYIFDSYICNWPSFSKKGYLIIVIHISPSCFSLSLSLSSTRMGCIHIVIWLILNILLELSHHVSIKMWTSYCDLKNSSLIIWLSLSANLTFYGPNVDILISSIWPQCRINLNILILIFISSFFIHHKSFPFILLKFLLIYSVLLFIKGPLIASCFSFFFGIFI